METAFVQETLDSGGILGLVLRSGSERVSTSFWTSEFVEQFPEFDDVMPPSLVFSLAREGGLRGDFNETGAYETDDIDLLCGAIQAGANDEEFDLTQDGELNVSDLAALTQEMGVLAGDTNLDKMVDFADFLQLSASFGTASQWHQGDFDCSGTTEFADFLLLSTNFGQASAAIVVPEPAALATAGSLFVLVGLLRMGDSRRRGRRWTSGRQRCAKAKQDEIIDEAARPFQSANAS